MRVATSATKLPTLASSALLVVATAGSLLAAESPRLLTAPAYQPTIAAVGLPPAFEDRLLYYNGFEGAEGKAEVRAEGVERKGRLTLGPDGFLGRGALTGKRGWLRLESEAFSPHRPLTVSFWWALVEDHPIDGGFGLVHLSGGRGFIGHFSRGKGNWCQLQRPAGILQVYYLPGIKNVNGIYDRDLMAHLDLRGGLWHHTALVVRGASLVEVYTDGEKAWETRVRGRPFRAADGLHDLVIGTRGGAPMVIDEVIVLRRALLPGDIARYVGALRQMRAVGYP